MKDCGGKYKWKTSSTKDDNDVTMRNSLPWKLDAACNVDKNSQLCYEIEFNSKSVTVCVNGGSEAILNDHGIDYIKQEIDVEWTKRINPNDSQHFDKLQVCHQQKFLQADDAIIKTYVAKDDEITCNSVIEDASLHCNRHLIDNLFESIGSQRYECIIDTGHVSDFNSKIETEMKWVRNFKYPCKDDGWYCSDTNLTHFTGGQECNINDDCHTNIEVGICDFSTKTCKTGSSMSKQCTNHEDCDVMSTYAKGECESGTCSKGANQLKASYFKPLECNEGLGNTNSSGHKYKSKHQYCGEVNHGTGKVFTGYCATPKDKQGADMKSFRACKPFETEAEKHIIWKEETDYQHGSPETFHHNFHIETPPWELLTLCPASHVKKVGNTIICDATMEEVDVKLPKVILASSADQAQEKCHVEYPSITTFSRLKY